MYYEYVPDARPYAEPHNYKGVINLYVHLWLQAHQRNEPLRALC